MANDEVQAWLDGVPAAQRPLVDLLRELVRANIDPGFEAGLQYRMLGWYVPFATFPEGYHCDPKQPVPFAAVGAQKGHVGLYLFGLYLDPSLMPWLEAAWAETGKKLDAGKSCLRFKRVEDVPTALVAEALRRMPLDAFLAHYVASRPAKKGKAKA